MTKMISVRDEVYDWLSKKKRSDESFSDLILRMGGENPRDRILELAGSWKDWEEADEIFKHIFNRRHRRSRNRVKT